MPTNYQLSTINQVRVRFAPSPSGYLHVGGARTALYNFLFARQNNGQFILRIEDTDKNRSTEKAISEIIDSLKWLGLNFDEGLSVGGGYGPYRQTERLKLYKDASKTLLEENKAYRCFCSPDELKRRRNEQLSKGEAPSYDKTCRNLSQKQIEELLNKKCEYTIRFAAPSSGTTIVNDLIKGDVSFENKSLDDYIIMRSDKTPTYNLAVVVDDNAMKITHVIRGDDHLSNTPKQIALYNALDYKIPQFAHLPLIIGDDKKPLSKRHGSVAIAEFKKQGYLPQALINYLALLGWGYDEKTTFFSLEDLIKKFSLKKVTKNPAMWDFKKLSWLNAEYIRNLSNDELSLKLENILKEEGIVEKDLAKLKKISPIIKERIKTLNEAVPLIEFFFKRIEPDNDTRQLLKKEENSAYLLKKSIDKLNKVDDFKCSDIEKALRTLAADIGIKPRVLFQLIRAGVSGRKISPPLFESLEILGKAESVFRLEKTCKKNRA